MNLNDLGKIVAQKETEWRSAMNEQIKLLQENLNGKEEILKQLNEKYGILKRDFKYNLKLLEDRDKELKQYDSEYVKLKTFQSEYLNVISDLKIKISSLQQKFHNSENSKSQIALEFQKQINSYKMQIEGLNRNKSKEIDEVNEKNFLVKNELERKIKFLESEIECQRLKLIAELEAINKNKEIESREKWKNKNAEILSHELRVKLLTKENELVQNDKKVLTETLNKRDAEFSELKRNLEKAEFNAKDITAIKNARIMELEKMISDLKSNEKIMKNEFSQKHSEMDKELRLKQMSIEESRKAFLEKESALKQKIFDLETKLKFAEQEIMAAISSKENELKMLRQEQEQLKSENIFLKSQVEKQLSRVSEITVSKDIEISKLNKDVDFLKRENVKYQKSDSQNDRFSAPKNHREIKGLVNSNNDLVAENKRLHDEILSYQELKDKNTELQNVIQKMANEMQVLSKTEANMQYVDELESEVIELRKLKRDVAVTVSPISDVRQNTKIDPENPDVAQHVLGLNKTIENLRIEKVGLNAEIRKQQVRLQHFEDKCNNIELEKNKMTARNQELEYEIAVCKKRHQQEELILKNQIDALKLSLAESQKEADEYYKGGLDHNLWASELEYQISKMQLDMASTSNWVSSNSHKLLVSQLRGENKKLRSELAHAKMLMVLGDSDKTSGKLSAQLYTKLKEAANKISDLMQNNFALKEKIKMLEISNIQMPDEKGDVDLDMDMQPSKLNQLENLQYELTRQELKFAQIDKPILAAMEGENAPKIVEQNQIKTDKKMAHSEVSKREVLKPVQLSINLSSIGDPNMKDVWGLLDDNLTSDNSNAVQAQIKTVNKVKKAQPPQSKMRIVKRGKKPKIRNYNIRNGSS